MTSFLQGCLCMTHLTFHKVGNILLPHKTIHHLLKSMAIYVHLSCESSGTIGRISFFKLDPLYLWGEDLCMKEKNIYIPSYIDTTSTGQDLSLKKHVYKFLIKLKPTPTIKFLIFTNNYEKNLFFPFCAP